MQSIHTRFHPQTNTRPARVSAHNSGGTHSEIVSVDAFDSAEAAERGVALALATRLQWAGNWVGGPSADGRGMTYVCTDPRFTWGFSIPIK